MKLIFGRRAEIERDGVWWYVTRHCHGEWETESGYHYPWWLCIFAGLALLLGVALLFVRG